MLGNMWILPAVVILLQFAPVRCKICISGYYSHNGRCSPCQKNCAECMWSNMCKSCKNGYFLFGSSCQPCPPNCLSCSLTSRSTCDACKMGYYGIGCTLSCSGGCKSRECYKTGGHCRYGCMYGYFGKSCSRCSASCTTCSSPTSCTSCQAGYYGSRCAQKCHNCRNDTCSLNGICIDGCIDGYSQGTADCVLCPGSCSKCTSDSVCVACKTGFFGSKCSQPCLNCRNNSCLMNGLCTYDCIDGFFQGTTSCTPCPDHCSKCKNDSVCDQCMTGYFGTKCDQPCRNCRKNSCSINSRCIHGCKAGFYQDTKTCTVCPENCSTCGSASVCHECKPGHYGTSCQYHCPGTCYKCGDGVIKTCDGNCSDCIDGCSKVTGECFRCLDGYHKTGGHCQRCRSGCAECIDSNNCTTCRHSYDFLPETGDCVKDSPSVTASSRLSVILGTTLGVVLLALAVLIIWMIMRRGFCKQTVQPHANQSLRYRGRLASNKVHDAGGCHDDTSDTDVGCITTIEANTDNVYSELDIESVHSSRQSEDLECGGDGLRRAEPGGDGLEMNNLYDETFTFQRPTMHAAAAVRGDGEDTYSHIRHVSLSRQHPRHDDDDSTYDHVTVASRPHQGDVDDTYDIVNGSNVKLN